MPNPESPIHPATKAGGPHFARPKRGRRPPSSGTRGPNPPDAAVGADQSARCQNAEPRPSRNEMEPDARYRSPDSTGPRRRSQRGTPLGPYRRPIAPMEFPMPSRPACPHRPSRPSAAANPSLPALRSSRRSAGMRRRHSLPEPDPIHRNPVPRSWPDPIRFDRSAANWTRGWGAWEQPIGAGAGLSPADETRKRRKSPRGGPFG